MTSLRPVPSLFAALILLSSSVASAQDAPASPPPAQVDPAADAAPRIDPSPPSETPPPPPPPVEQAPPPSFAPALPPTFSTDASSAHDERLDSMLPISASSLVLGGALMLGGALTFASISSDEYCGVTGCVDRPTPLEMNIGASLVGAGLGFAVVGAFGMIGWASNAPKGTDTRADEKLMSAGLSAVSLAGASLGLGIAQALTYDDRSVDFSTAWPFFLTSGVLSAVGIPLLVVGADVETDADREAERQRKIAVVSPAYPKKMYSPGMVIGGSILTGIGGLAGLAGTVTLILDLGAGDHYRGLISLILGAPLLGGGGIFCAIGVPLIAVGTKPDVGLAEKALQFVPTVDVGPLGLRASWSLE